MAFTKEIVKGDVKHSAGNFMIYVDCIVKEDGVECGRQTFSVDYKPGTDVTSQLQKLKIDMQEFVNRVKQERTVRNAVLLDSGITWLNANVTV